MSRCVDIFRAAICYPSMCFRRPKVHQVEDCLEKTREAEDCDWQELVCIKDVVSKVEKHATNCQWRRQNV